MNFLCTALDNAMGFRPRITLSPCNSNRTRFCVGIIQAYNSFPRGCLDDVLSQLQAFLLLRIARDGSDPHNTLTQRGHTPDDTSDKVDRSMLTSRYLQEAHIHNHRECEGYYILGHGA